MFNLFKRGTKILKDLNKDSLFLKEDRDMLYNRVVSLTREISEKSKELDIEKNYSAMLKKQLEIINGKSRSIIELIEDGYCDEMDETLTEISEDLVHKGSPQELAEEFHEWLTEKDKKPTHHELIEKFEKTLNSRQGPLAGSCTIIENGVRATKTFNREKTEELLAKFKSGELELVG